MATTYIRGKLHTPTWMTVPEGSDNNDTRLVLPADLNNAWGSFYANYSNNNNTGVLELMGDWTQPDNLLGNNYNVCTIGNKPPHLGEICVYSDDDVYVNNVSGTSSRHVIYFKHAMLQKLYFKIMHNHVINRISKLYRNTTDSNNNIISTIDNDIDNIIEHPDWYKLTIADLDIQGNSEATISDSSDITGTKKLTLVERSR